VAKLKYFGATPTKTAFMKKIRAELTEGVLAIIRSRSFCLPVYYPKNVQIKINTTVTFACCFMCM